MTDTVARIISWLLHPLFMCVYAALIYYFMMPQVMAFSNQGQWVVIALLLLTTVLLPAASVFVLVRMGRVRSLQMEEQQQRNWPLLQTTLIYGMCYYMMKDKNIPVFIVLFVLGALLNMIIALICNQRWKISLHSIGAAGLAGGIAALFLRSGDGPVWIAALLFVLAGAVGTARLQLRAHSPVQVAVGLVAGFVVQFGVVFFLWKDGF
ncbi:MAG: hypothetical protein MUC87_21445 [Bacteroidia bacterium]|jgi:hypothetical protein|nr:hypothetical protein [Bacteroidia bacterium]